MEKNDHRKLGQQMSLYHIQENAPGMVFWHQNGYAIYRVLEDYIRKKMRMLGYKEIKSPQLMPKELWQASGHWDKFKHNMFCVEEYESDSEYALKPMSCPCHVQIFNQGIKSYRDLPVRYAEFGACHRNEPSGSMHGLMRSRSFEQDDAHVLCKPEDVRKEVARFIGLLDAVYRDLGFKKYKVALSTRPAVYSGSLEKWAWAEEQLKLAAEENNLSFIIQEGEGAFYGPKLEFILEDNQGREWQCGTVQLDSVLPARLDAYYVDEDGEYKNPLMIHHAVFGSMGRFIAILLEHYEGMLPFWLAPEQVAVMSISEKFAEYAENVHQEIFGNDVRSVLYDMNDTLSRKIIKAMQVNIPVMIIVGKKEMENKSVSVRLRDGSNHSMPLSDLYDFLKSL